MGDGQVLAAGAAPVGVHRLLLSTVRDEYVAEAPHRLNVDRFARVGFDQPAQARNLHVYAAVEGLELAPAGELHQFVARERLARVLDQRLQQRELTGGERHVGAPTREIAGTQVEGERAERDAFVGHARRAGRGGRTAAAQNRVDARHQLARVERLGQIVVRAHFQADDAIDLVAFGREHYDGNIVAAAAQAPADRQPEIGRAHV